MVTESTPSGASGRVGSDAVAPKEAAGARRLLRPPLTAAASFTERLVSRRALALAALALVAALTVFGGLRPPLDADVSSVRVPLDPIASEAAGAEALLEGAAPIAPSNVGFLLLLLIAGGAVVVLARPCRAGGVAGVVLAGAIVGCAALCLNHPGLIERLELELEGRQWIVRLIEQRDRSRLAGLWNGRATMAVAPDGEWAGAIRSAGYLVGLQWTVVIAGLLHLFGSRRPLAARLVSLAGWSGLGLMLSAAVCHERIVAEWHWYDACQRWEQGDASGARRALGRALRACEPLARLQRTWYLTGELDHAEGRATPEECLYRAHQLLRNAELEESRAAIDDLLAFDPTNPEARRGAARLLTVIALEQYRRHRRGVAGALWRRASWLDPGRPDLSFFLGTLRLDLDPMHPELAEQEYRPILRRLADRRLRAELSATLAEANFDAGRMAAARRYFRDSMREFNRPNAVNYRSWRGLVGL